MCSSPRSSLMPWMFHCRRKAATRAGAVGWARRAGGVVAELLGERAVVVGAAAAHPERAPDRYVVAAARERGEHRAGVRQSALVPGPLREAVVADQHRAVEVIDAGRDAERVVHEDVLGD